MRQAIVVLCVFGLTEEMQTVQRYFMSRNTRSNAAPVRAGYVYTQTNSGPATIETLHDLHADDKSQDNGGKNAMTTDAFKKSAGSAKEMKSNKTQQKPPMSLKNSISFSATEKQLWPSGKLKLAASGMVKTYDSIFRTRDDEDIRSDFKNFYDMWPFFYQNIYEYKPKKLDDDVEKAKDKRFAIPTHDNAIPVHEKVDETADDQNSETESNSGQDYDMQTNAATTDNPNFGNQPFFSYVLNDYFDKTDEDDLPTFKGLPWGKDFDHEMALQDIDDYAKRIRRLEKNTPNVNREENEKKSDTHMEHDATHESLNSKGRDSLHESESNEKGDDSKYGYDGKYQYDGENYKGFKDFADSFAHRFGSEDHDRASNYAKKNNAHKGENKKGFRTIHHKDEYQEHHDFFDNSDNSENAEEQGASKFNIGGSEAFLRSVAGAVTGSDENKLSNGDSIESKQFERNREDKQRYGGIERELDQYRDVAKRTALSNNADYVDRYMI